MRILATSDWHPDAKTLGHARFADVDIAVRETVDAAIDLRVDAYVFLGDLCDPDSGSAAFRCVELAMSAALALARSGIESHWMAGNHDVIEDGSGDTTLSPLRELYRHTMQSGKNGVVYVHERPALVHLKKTRAALFLPYTATSHAYQPNWETAEVLKHMLTPEEKLIVFGHLAVEGVIPGEETTEMPRGRDVLFPRQLFPDSMADRVVLMNGHYHRQQRHRMPGFCDVHIPGAPTRFTFGEQDNTPGYLLVEV